MSLLLFLILALTFKSTEGEQHTLSAVDTLSATMAELL